MSRKSKKKAIQRRAAAARSDKPAGLGSESGPAAFRARWPVLGICLFLTVITWLVFGQTLRHEFVNFDDYAYVTNVPLVTAGLTSEGVRWAFTNRHSGNWHPLTTLSHMLDCQLYGLDAHRHHLTNVILHTVAVLLLFLVLRQMTGGTWRSAFVAALFAIHPLRVESVAWVAERKDVLSGIFFMLTLGAYVRYARNPALPSTLLVVLSFALGLMSKPMLVTVPFVLLLLDYWPLARFGRSGPIPWRLVLEKIPLLLMSAASCAATVLAQTDAIIGTEQLSFGWRAANAVTSYVAYLWQTIWPVDLAVLYPHPESNYLQSWQVAGAVALLGVITAVAFAVRRKHPYLITGWLWYVGMLVPVIGLIQVGSQARADRYTYLPHIGIFLVVAWGVSDWAKQWGLQGRKILGAAAAVVIAVLTLTACKQASYWRDEETLWIHTLAITSHNQWAQANYAYLLLRRERPQEAIPHFEASLALWRGDAQIHRMYALALLQVGKLGAAIPHWEAILETEPRDSNAQANLAWIYATSPQSSMRDGVRAVILIEDVIAQTGRKNASVLRTCAAAYAECARFSEAIETAKEAAQLAIVQGNSTLAADLGDDIGGYQKSLPLRDPNLAEVRRPPRQR